MTTLFPTTVVGSLPRPLWLKELFDDVDVVTDTADIPLDEAYAKLRNMARAAKILRERHA